MGVSKEPNVPGEAGPKESRLSRFLARRWAVPGVIAGAVAIVTLACLTPDLIARWQLARERDAIRTRGEPATLAELAPELPPGHDNAAVLLVQAFKLMDASSAAEPANWTEFLLAGESAHRADAAAVVKLHAKAMALAREALRRPRCVFDLDYTEGEMWDVPHVGFVHLAKLFASGAILEAMRGEPVKTADSLRMVFLLADALNDCDSTGQIITHHIFHTGTKALRRTERACRFGDAERRMLIRSVSSMDWRKAATDSYLAERVLLVDATKAIADELGGGGGWLRGMSSSHQSPLSHRERLRVWRLYSELIEASRLRPWEARDVVCALYGEMAKIIPWLSNDMFGDTDFYVPYQRAMATRDAAVIGLSCGLFRSARGRYPSKLDELAPEFLDKLPPDPFTGKPFRYELRDGGASFIVYSLGENLKDDGGVKDPAAQKDDISWEGRE